MSNKKEQTIMDEDGLAEVLNFPQDCGDDADAIPPSRNYLHNECSIIQLGRGKVVIFEEDYGFSFPYEIQLDVA